MLLMFVDMVPRREKLQVPPCVRGAIQKRTLLRQHKDNEERARFQFLCSEPQVRGHSDRGGRRRRIPSVAFGSCEYLL